MTEEDKESMCEHACVCVHVSLCMRVCVNEPFVPHHACGDHRIIFCVSPHLSLYSWPLAVHEVLEILSQLPSYPGAQGL